MATKKKKLPSARAPKIKEESISCTYSLGGPCAMQVAASEILLISFSKTLWEHRETAEKKWIVKNIFMDNPEGRFDFFVRLTLHLGEEAENDVDISLMQFLHEFVPCGEISFESYAS